MARMVPDCGVPLDEHARPDPLADVHAQLDDLRATFKSFTADILDGLRELRAGNDKIVEICDAAARAAKEREQRQTD